MELDDYTKATFPLDIKRPGDHTGWVRLYGAMNDKVIGLIWYGETFETGWPSQAIIWDGQGKYTDDGRYPDMDLPPPLALRNAKITEWRAQIEERQARLEANPDAPDEWREVDLMAIESTKKRIAALLPPEPIPDADIAVDAE